MRPLNPEGFHVNVNGTEDTETGEIPSIWIFLSIIIILIIMFAAFLLLKKKKVQSHGVIYEK